MNTATLTIRLPIGQRELIRQAAGALKKTESEYIRDALARDLDSVPFRERVGDLAGCLRLSRLPSAAAHPLKERIRAANWRE
jgi:hypothetical protein